MDNNNRLLLVIDAQVDFLEGGKLAVKGAKGIMDDLARYIEKYGKDYKNIVFTMDQHPIKHCSFKENGGEWPMHCVQYSEGAAIYEPLLQAAINSAKENPDLNISFIEKGRNPIKEEYSAFDESNRNNKVHFFNIVDFRGIKQIDVVGIASEFCVLNSIKDLLKMGMKDKINVMEEFIPAIGDGTELHKFVEENNLKK